jgi:hypothetical protein
MQDEKPDDEITRQSEPENLDRQLVLGLALILLGTIAFSIAAELFR